jgi:hypothetical protein
MRDHAELDDGATEIAAIISAEKSAAAFAKGRKARWPKAVRLA